MNRHGIVGMWALAWTLLWCAGCEPAAKPVAQKSKPAAEDNAAQEANAENSATEPSEGVTAKPAANMPAEEKTPPAEPATPPAKSPDADVPAPEPATKPAAPADKEKMPAQPPVAAESKPGVAESKATETKPTETKPAESKPAETKPAEAAPVKVLLGSAELTAGIPGSGPLKLSEIKAWFGDPQNMAVLDVELPLGLSAGQQQIKGLDANALTKAKIELGRQLYFDPRLSADQSVSCASCHAPESGWAAHTQFGVGIRGQTGGRNSPVSYNRILSDLQFWDGRAASLEAQALGPIANPIEMGNTHEACMKALSANPGYQAEFAAVFGEMNIEAVGKAIASFERAIVTGPTPYDYYERFRPLEKLDPDDLKTDDPATYAKYVEFKKALDDHPMSDSARRGRELFFSEKTNCTACHVGPNFSDEKYHNLGIGMDKPEPDLGREAVTHDEKDRGAFKTPTIRNVAQSGPYMHDGSLKTLEEVVDWYAKGGHPNPHLDAKIKKLELSDQDKQDLVEFMKACTGDFPKIETGRLPE